MVPPRPSSAVGNRLPEATDSAGTHQPFAPSPVVVSKADDAKLVRQCLEGDTDAFGTLIERYEKQMFSAVYRMVHDYEEARDITQSVFVKAFEKLGQFDDRYKFYSWIYRIAMNQSINWLNQRKPVQAVDESWVSEERSPEGKASDGELSRIIGQALMKISPDYRSVVVLRHFRQYSYRDIGSILNIPEKTVKSRLFTARQQLKDVLANRGVL